jgi:formylglycine-generating enzyme required for sulfatase activity
MALVPAGSFQMGSDDEESEQPVHKVTLDAFYIDVYEVTNGRYAECVQAGSCKPPVSSDSKTRPGYFEAPAYADYPVVNVSWSMAQAYCEWRGARLPSEAEWEKAARGGLAGMDYPWGNEQPVCKAGAPNGARFWEPENCDWTDTEKAGSYSPNGYGLYDMAGNVWEFVQDFYAPYESGAQSNPAGPAKGLFHAIRGGAWVNMSSQVRVSARIQEFGFDYSYFGLGFRCARSQ